MDESGVFFKQGRRSTYVPKDGDCAGGKNAKDRVTVLLCTSMTGEKMKPLVVGRSKKPRCFKSVKVDSLPVTYRHNKKAWMNGRLYEEWITSVDKKMRRQNRHILMFMDNASAHQETNLTNVKVVRFPANCTSVLQPLDQGIIQAMKLKFYSMQSRRVIERMDSSSLSGPELLKELTVLDTIYWIAKAWDNVTAQCIGRCFLKSGFEVLQQPLEDNDTEEDDDIPLAQLARAQPIYGCSLVDLANSNVQAVEETEIDWDKNANDLLAESDESGDEDEEEDEEETQQQSVTKEEARACVEKLKTFASSNGLTTFLTGVMDVSTQLTDFTINACTQQKKITSFFK